MKTIVYCHTGLIYHVSDSLFERFTNATSVAKNDINDPDELIRVNKEISSRYKPSVANYMATAWDEEGGLF